MPLGQFGAVCGTQCPADSTDSDGDGYPDCADDCPDQADINVALTAASADADVGGWNANYAAGMAIDGSDSTYWCTPANTETAVFTLDLGGAVAVSGLQIQWAYFSDDFTVATSTDGESFTDAFTGGATARGQLSNIPNIDADAQYVRITAHSGDLYSGEPIIGIYELAIHTCTVDDSCSASSTDSDGDGYPDCADDCPDQADINVALTAASADADV
eukprot:SAG31_NODE_9155_length_1324_cov_2.601633_2_plen_216_part_01